MPAATQVEIAYPGNVNSAHGASVSSSTVGVHPLLERCINHHVWNIYICFISYINQNLFLFANSHIDAMVVESVAAGVEPLGVVVKHLLEADRAVV